MTYVHPELLTPLYSVQVVWFSAIFTSSKYPHSILEPILNDTSQNLMGFKSYWVVNCLEQAYASLGCNKQTGHPDFNKAISMCLFLPFWMLCGPWEFRILLKISMSASAFHYLLLYHSCPFIICWLWQKDSFSVTNMLRRSSMSIIWKVAIFWEPIKKKMLNREKKPHRQNKGTTTLTMTDAWYDNGQTWRGCI